jgi:hypothetical protein
VSNRMERLSPASNTKFGAQILKENRIPGVHPIGSVGRSLPVVPGLSMYRRMHFVELIASVASCRSPVRLRAVPVGCCGAAC